MNRNNILVAIAVFFIFCSMMRPGQPAEILLWPKGAPGSEGKTGDEKLRISDQGDQVVSHINAPSIIPFLASAKKNTGAAIIIAPGGGHSELWISHEGYAPANWFTNEGISTFVLKYRLANEKGSTYTVDKEELMDIQRAIRLVRSRAKEWGIDTAKIGVMGFSAGGELAALSAMHYTPANAALADPIDRLSDKPDFQALIYPGNINRLSVSANSPPVFIAGGYQDRDNISVGMAELYIKYKQAKIPAELHIYASTGHGFGIRDANKGSFTDWPGQVKHWLADLGMIKPTK